MLRMKVERFDSELAPNGYTNENNRLCCLEAVIDGPDNAQILIDLLKTFFAKK